MKHVDAQEVRRPSGTLKAVSSRKQSVSGKNQMPELRKQNIYSSTSFDQ